MDLNKLLTELSYPAIVGQAVRNKIIKDENTIREMAKTAYHGENFEFPLCRKAPLTRLSVITYLLLQKFEAYKQKGVEDSIVLETFRDVSIRADLYFRRYKKSGLSKDDVIWFRHIINIGIFKIGSLQFQPFEMLYMDEETIGERYMTFLQEQKEKLPPHTPVLNCHIQRGADLRKTAVHTALENAKTFFKKVFPNVKFEAVICYSWLLYPPMQEILPDKSNIRQFAENFSIISDCRDTKQAFENLFGDALKSKENIPDPTSLQKQALEHPELFGFACGVIKL